MNQFQNIQENKIERLIDQLSENIRQSGRTTRALKRAIELTKTNDKVYFVIANYCAHRYLSEMVMRITNNDKKILEKIEFISVKKNNGQLIDLNTMTVRGNRSYPVVVDHYVYETML